MSDGGIFDGECFFLETITGRAVLAAQDSAPVQYTELEVVGCATQEQNEQKLDQLINVILLNSSNSALFFLASAMLNAEAQSQFLNALVPYVRLLDNDLGGDKVHIFKSAYEMGCELRKNTFPHSTNAEFPEIDTTADGLNAADVKAQFRNTVKDMFPVLLNAASIISNNANKFMRQQAPEDLLAVPNIANTVKTLSANMLDIYRARVGNAICQVCHEEGFTPGDAIAPG